MFWASDMNDVVDVPIYFRGIAGPDDGAGKVECLDLLFEGLEDRRLDHIGWEEPALTGRLGENVKMEKARTSCGSSV